MVSEEPSRPVGPRVLRAVAIVVLALVVLWVLFTQVFPRVESYLEDPTLDAGRAAVVTVVGRG